MTQNHNTNSITVIQDSKSELAISHRSELPPILSGHETPKIRRETESFYGSVALMFEAWLKRRPSHHTQRAYRQDVMNLVDFMQISWPRPNKNGILEGLDESWRFLKITVPEIQAWRDYLKDDCNAAALSMNRRISSVSGFYKYMREAAAEARLPITVPNPAHSQFISRETQAPVTPTESLSATRARQVMAMPEGESLFAYRDRAILKLWFWIGPRIATVCRLHVADFIDDEEDPKVLLQEKGKGRSKRAEGINVVAADAVREYIRKSGVTSGPLFRPRNGPRGKEFANRPMTERAMYNLIQSYLRRVPGAMKEIELPDGSKAVRCIYTPHSLRATAATLSLESGEPIESVQELMGHKNVLVTQVYDKRKRRTKDSASHRLVY